MKIAVALLAAGFVASFKAVTPANAQKDPACIEKCNRSNVASGGGMQSRGTAQAVRACLSGLPEGKRGQSEIADAGRPRLLGNQGLPRPWGQGGGGYP